MSKPIDPQLVELIAHQEQSGLSVAAYAREHDISSWKLYDARRALRKRDPEFIELDMDRVEVVADASLEIVLPHDLRVRVPPNFDADSLRRLVGALSSC